MNTVSSQRYIETNADNNGWWRFFVYHFDASGNNEIYDHKSEFTYPSRANAEDAGVEWCDEHDFDDPEILCVK